MNTKIKTFLLNVIDKTDNNEIVWLYQSFYTTTLPDGTRISVNKAILDDEVRYILEFTSNTIAGSSSDDAWLSLFNAAKENVFFGKIITE